MTATTYHVRDSQLLIISNDQEIPFSQISIDDATALRFQLEDDALAMADLERHHITDPMEQLEKFVRCEIERLRAGLDIIHNQQRTGFECGLQLNCLHDYRRCGRTLTPTGELLTEIELKILRLIAADMSNTEIAQVVFRSEHTIKSHVRHLLQKTGRRTRTGLATFYITQNKN